MTTEPIELLPVISWPEIDHDFDAEKDDIEHIDMRVDHHCFDSLLNEVDFDFPHVAPKLRLLIGHEEFEVAVSKLIIDERGGRQGFPPHIVNLLLKLSKLHTSRFGHLQVSHDPWYNGVKR